MKLRIAFRAAESVQVFLMAGDFDNQLLADVLDVRIDVGPAGEQIANDAGRIMSTTGERIARPGNMNH